MIGIYYYPEGPNFHPFRFRVTVNFNIGGRSCGGATTVKPMSKMVKVPYIPVYIVGYRGPKSSENNDTHDIYETKLSGIFSRPQSELNHVNSRAGAGGPGLTAAGIYIVHKNGCGRY